MKIRAVLTICALAAVTAFPVPAVAAAAAAERAEKAAPTCADFLASLKRKPVHLVFVKCVPEPDRQGKPLHATYSVSGVYAARVEAALIKSVGLTRLKTSCCQWDSPPTYFKAPDGQEFMISMASVETKIRSRSAWHKIPRFDISVRLMTEEI